MDKFDFYDMYENGQNKLITDSDYDNCVKICQDDLDQDYLIGTQCWYECQSVCEYLQYHIQRKCINHLMTHISQLRDFGIVNLPIDGRKQSAKPKRGPDGRIQIIDLRYGNNILSDDTLIRNGNGAKKAIAVAQVLATKSSSQDLHKLS